MRCWAACCVARGNGLGWVGLGWDDGHSDLEEFPALVPPLTPRCFKQVGPKGRHNLSRCREAPVSFFPEKQRREIHIRTQIEHHARETFEDEYIRLLDKHDVEYDPRYVWD